MGGLSLNLYTDFRSLDPGDIGLEPGDPRWVGAWWLGLLLFGTCVLFIFFPVSGYPSDLPGAAEVRAKKRSEAYDVNKDEIPEDYTKIGFQAKDIIPYTKDILTNVTLIFLTLYIACDMSLIAAFTIYGPKFVEVMFSLTAGQAGILFGILVVPAAVIGTVGAGVIIERLKLSLYDIMRWETVISVVVVLMGPLFLIRCQQPDFIGVNTPYNDSSTDLIATCNIDCQCKDVSYTPICSHQSQQFFSPCHAGCTDKVDSTDDDPTSFYNCSCIPDPPSPDEPHATWSICPSPDCDLIPLFCVMLFIAMVGLFISEAMNITTLFRVLPNKQRVYGFFISGLAVKLIGTTPGPLIFAAAFDASCVLWQETCGQRGSCFFYDTERLAWYIMGISILLKGSSIVCMFFAFWLYKPPRIEQDEVEIAKEVPDEENHGEKLAVATEVTEL